MEGRRTRWGKLPGRALPLEHLVEDLSTLLSGERAAYFAAGPAGAILAVKSGKVFSFGQVRQDPPWMKLSGRERAETVVHWIRRAAATCRDLRKGHESKSPSFEPVRAPRGSLDGT